MKTFLRVFEIIFVIFASFRLFIMHMFRYYAFALLYFLTNFPKLQTCVSGRHLCLSFVLCPCFSVFSMFVLFVTL